MSNNNQTRSNNTSAPNELEKAQTELCSRYKATCVPPRSDSKTGFAVATKGRTPMNGLRHPTTTETSGWYIWFGEEFSEARDFFSPIHTFHIYEEYPELQKLLGLPPGFRFLLAGDYLDIWFDASLLNV